MLLDGLVIGCIVSLFRGGKFKNLLNIQLQAIWLILFAFVVQYGAIFIFPNLLWIATPVSYFILMLFGYYNRKQAGVRFIIVGIALNLIVMVANQGRMPVDVNSAKKLYPELVPQLLSGSYGKHIAMSNYTNFNLLGDIFYLHWPYPHQTLISLGDILFSIGIFLFVQNAMVIKETSLKGNF